MKKIYVNEKFPHFLHGGDYNPEQWIDTKEIWDEDMRLMKLANCNEMTICVCAWSTLEPEEDKFDFSFLDEIIEKIGKNGGKVILATPTTAPPFWLMKKYPDAVLVEANGMPAVPKLGSLRGKRCYSSPSFRKRVEIIVRKLAERYAFNDTVVAWHLDNEIHMRCFCENCKKKFREFLKNKYKTIENFNKNYWTKWSSGEVSSFDDVNPPINRDPGFDALYLDWQRFSDKNIAEYFKFQADIIKSVNKDARVTVNLMPQRDYDLYEHAKIADFSSIDIYPNWGRKSEVGEAIDSAWQYDYVRSTKGKPFVLMESAPGYACWMSQNKIQRPGICTLASISAVAHGSDSVGYFQFRKSRGAAEQHHGAVVGHVGNENTRLFREIAKTGDILKTIDEVCGSVTESEVAVYYDAEVIWALDVAWAFAPRRENYYGEDIRYYGAVWKNSVNTDLINRDSDFSKYKLIIMPMAYIVSEELQDKIAAFVKNGGTIFATYMLGYVNENALCHLGGFPGGKLKEVFGIWNEEIDSIFPEDSQKVNYNGKDYEAREYCEVLHLKGAKALANYTTDYYKDTPCFTVNEYGKGKAYYQAFRDTGAFKEDTITEILKECGIKSCLASKHEGVTAQVRTDGENEYLFIQNFSNDKVDGVKLNGVYEDLLTGEKADAVSLEKFAFKVMKRKIK